MKMSIIRILVFIALLLPFGVSAQISISESGVDPDASSVLDLQSTDKGILVPRMTDAQRDAIVDPATGLMVFVNTDSSFYYFDGTDWVGLSTIFEHRDTVVRLNPGRVDMANTDFVFGSPQMDDDGIQDHDNRLFFHKTLGAFRAGSTNNTQWDAVNVGEFSTAFGKNNTASGKFSFAFGRRSTASGMLSFTAGEDAVASGDYSLAMGNQVLASNAGSVAVGYLSEATGVGSVALGFGIKAPSAFENAIGTFPTEYTPSSTVSFWPTDRLFTIGNGTDPFNRSDALIILKNGSTFINGALTIDSSYTLPTIDGTNGQVLSTDGSGTLGWTTLTDSDNQDLSLSGNSLILTNDATPVDLSGYLDNTDQQDLNLTGNSLSLTNDATPVDLSGYLDNTDAQTLSLSSNTLSLTNGGSVDLSIYENANTTLVQDTDHDTKIQVEESADEDKIRFDVAGVEQFRIETNPAGIGRVTFPFGTNVMMGNTSGENVSTGVANTFVGNFTGQGTSAGSYNVFVGDESGRYQNGDNNVFVGRQAGMNASTGSGNIFLGYKAGFSETGSNKLFIENSNSVNPLIYGEFDNDLVRVNGDLNIGGGLSIGNEFSFPTIDGNANQVLLTDGNGTLSWSNQSDNQDLSLSGNTLSLTGDASVVDLSSFMDNTDNQDLSLSGNILSLSGDPSSVSLSGYLDNTDNQTLSFNGTDLSISNGNSVDISSAFTSNTIYNSNGSINGTRTIQLNNTFQLQSSALRNALTLKRGGADDIGLAYMNSGSKYTAAIVSPAVSASNYAGLDFYTVGSETDPNNLGATMQLTDAGDVIFPQYGQGNNTGSLAKILAVTSSGEVIEVNSADIGTDEQALSLSSDILSLTNGGSVDLSGYLDNTDQQDLSLTGNSLSLTNDATPVDLSGYLDNTDAQSLSLSTNTLSLTNGGSVDLSGYLDNTDQQDLSLTGNSLSLTNDATPVDLSGYLDNTDAQSLSLSSNTLSLTNGGAVDLSSYEQNISLNSTTNTLHLSNGGSVNLSNYFNDNTTLMQDADNDTKIQVEESPDEDMIRFDLGGNEALIIGQNDNGLSRLTLKNANENIMINSGANLSTGADNIFIGTFAGTATVSGSENVYVGTETGFNATGSGNVFLGHRSGRNETNSNRLYIDNSDTSTPLIYGEFDNDLVRVNGTISVNDGTQAKGKVLTSDANGNAAWQDNNSRVAFVENTTSQTFTGSQTGWQSTQYVTNTMSAESGDVVVVQATFAVKLDGGGGSDPLRFRLGMGNGTTATFGGETASLDGFENTRNKFTQVSIQHTFTATSADDYVFRIFLDMGGTDDDVVMDNVNISAIKF